jgi:uncharacterized protein YbjQ (UPF0145 family)
MRLASVTFTIAFAGCTTVASQAPGMQAATTYSNDSSPVPNVLVTTERLCPPKSSGCDIVEVVDLHTSATSEDKGFDELRRRASAEGGDAVIGAEFEHGDDGGPSHLSGMVVKYAEPIPPHVDVGEVDIPSDENDQDKGLKAMVARAHEMGGDRVINVTFEHGDDGAQGHLHGLVVRTAH